MNIVLVHGAWADGSSWSKVIGPLQEAGHNVTAPQFPLTSLDDNLARLRQVLAVQDGPTVLAGHSYGGQIMTALGADAPNVVALVYIAAFGLDEGESIGGLLAQGDPTAALAHLSIDEQGFAWLPIDDFVGHFAADVDPADAAVMYAVQQPLSASALGDVMGAPAWKTLPSWYAVAQNDEAIPADAERLFSQRMGATVVELASGHVAMVSHPEEVADLIEAAAAAVRVAMAYDEILAARIRELLLDERGVREQKMFGGLAFLIGGNMAIAASGQGGVLVHVDKDQSDGLVKRTQAQPMVMRGRGMAGWLRVDAEHVRTKAQLRKWVDLGAGHARSLPAKTATKRKTTTTAKKAAQRR